MSHGLLTTADCVHPELISSKGGRIASGVCGGGVGEGGGGKQSADHSSTMFVCGHGAVRGGCRRAADQSADQLQGV